MTVRTTHPGAPPRPETDSALVFFATLVFSLAAALPAFLEFDQMPLVRSLLLMHPLAATLLAMALLAPSTYAALVLMPGAAKRTPVSIAACRGCAFGLTLVAWLACVASDASATATLYATAANLAMVFLAVVSPPAPRPAK